MDRVRSNATRLREQTDYFVVVSVIVDPIEPCWIDRARTRERNHRDERCHQKQCDDHQEWLVSGSSHYAPLPLFMGGRHCAQIKRGWDFRRSDELCQAQYGGARPGVRLSLEGGRERYDDPLHDDRGQSPHHASPQTPAATLRSGPDGYG